MAGLFFQGRKLNIFWIAQSEHIVSRTRVNVMGYSKCFKYIYFDILSTFINTF